jgi:hypothetical protein
MRSNPKATENMIGTLAAVSHSLEQITAELARRHGRRCAVDRGYRMQQAFARRRS